MKTTNSPKPEAITNAINLLLSRTDCALFISRLDGLSASDRVYWAAYVVDHAIRYRKRLIPALRFLGSTMCASEKRVAIRERCRRVAGYAALAIVRGV